MITQTFRLPRGLWQDLEETVIHQDRAFLSDVARSLGLPVQEVLRRCLGTGAQQPVPVLWAPSSSTTLPTCPWWECHGEGLWRRCPRLRLSPTLPCNIHERCTPCPLARLDSDPVIRDLPWSHPITWNNRVYWIDPTNSDTFAYREDGSIETDFRFRYVNFRGRRILFAAPIDG
jgi:hypothetical protein